MKKQKHAPSALFIHLGNIVTFLVSHVIFVSLPRASINFPRLHPRFTGTIGMYLVKCIKVVYEVIARISRIRRFSDLRKCTSATKADAEEVKRRSKRKKEREKEEEARSGGAEGREGRSKSRKTGSPSPQGSLLAGLFRRRLLRDLSRIKSRDASTSAPA